MSLLKLRCFIQSPSNGVRRYHVIERGRRLCKLSFSKYRSTEPKGYSKTCSEMALFKNVSSRFLIDDYDCVGFDLDNTLCKYRVDALVSLVFQGITKFLQEKKGYGPLIQQPLTRSDIDFMQRGLLIDKVRGNLIKVTPTGRILKGCHGNRELTLPELTTQYGDSQKWDLIDSFYTNLLKGPHERKLVHTLTDYFDLVCDVVFTRMIVEIDSKGKVNDYSFVAEDLIDALIDVFDWKQFAQSKGNYFPHLKTSIDKYVFPCSETVKQWLKGLKDRGKAVFLVTGSQWDYATHLCNFILGEDFKNYFDALVFSAGKPAFFTARRPFVHSEGDLAGTVVTAADMEKKVSYSMGNWLELKEFLGSCKGLANPRCLYVGDNALQDVVAPVKFGNLDVVACCEELMAEGLTEAVHPAADYLKSSYWGSYFGSEEEGQHKTLWGHVTSHYSKLVVPDVDALSSY